MCLSHPQADLEKYGIAPAVHVDATDVSGTCQSPSTVSPAAPAEPGRKAGAPADVAPAPGPPPAVPTSPSAGGPARQAADANKGGAAVRFAAGAFSSLRLRVEQSMRRLGAAYVPSRSAKAPDAWRGTAEAEPQDFRAFKQDYVSGQTWVM